MHAWSNSPHTVCVLLKLLDNIDIIHSMLGCNGVSHSIIQIKEEQCVTTQRSPDQIASDTGLKSTLIYHNVISNA